MIKAIDAAQGGLRDEFVTDPEHAASGEPAESIERVAAPSLSSLPSVQLNPEAPEQSRREDSEAANPQSEIPNPQSTVPLLTQEEKRRILARIARVNPLDCFDESGAFDIVRAKRILPPGMVRHIAVHEITRLNAEGQPITERRINVRLVDPVSAIRLDDQMERRRERAASSSSSPSESPSDSDSPPPHPASPEYAHNLLRKNTIALDEANHTLALLKKTLAEKQDRQRLLFKELDEKDHQLKIASKTLSEVEGQTPLNESSKTLSSVEGPPKSEGDTGCQPVNPKHPTRGESQNELPNHELSDHRGSPRPPPKAS